MVNIDKRFRRTGAERERFLHFYTSCVFRFMKTFDDSTSNYIKWYLSKNPKKLSAGSFVCKPKFNNCFCLIAVSPYQICFFYSFLTDRYLVHINITTSISVRSWQNCCPTGSGQTTRLAWQRAARVPSCVATCGQHALAVKH